MLAKLGCTYVVVGHSERRQYHDEDDALVNAKVKAALANGITPILCVGEGLEIREAGEHVRAHAAPSSTPASTGSRPSRSRRSSSRTSRSGRSAPARPRRRRTRRRSAARSGRGSPSRSAASAADAVRILYGGSVKADNIAAIMAQPDVDGALVGGASLDAEEFVQIVRFPEHLAPLNPAAGSRPAIL